MALMQRYQCRYGEICAPTGPKANQQAVRIRFDVMSDFDEPDPGHD